SARSDCAPRRGRSAQPGDDPPLCAGRGTPAAGRGVLMKDQPVGSGGVRGDSVDRMRPPSRLEAVVARVLAGGAGLVLGFIAACGPFNAPTTTCTQDSDCGLDTLHCNSEGHCE